MWQPKSWISKIRKISKMLVHVASGNHKMLTADWRKLVA